MFFIIIFFFATLSDGDSQSVPSFFIHRQVGDVASLQELPSVDLIEKPSGGNILIQWNAAFTSYHTALIKRSNYQLQLFCQCTANNVQQVTFFYLPSTGTTEEQPLLVDLRTSITASWPTFFQVEAQTINVNFNSTNGAYVTVLFNEVTNMSGTFRCELLTTSGVKLQSNVLNVFDIRKAVSALAAPVKIGPVTLYGSGVGKFQSAINSSMPYMKLITTYINSNLDWSIGSEEEIIAGNPTYTKGSGTRYFKPASKMDSTDLGQYHITQDGTLYVNMGSQMGANLKSALMSPSAASAQSIVMLSDANSIVGYKFFTKPSNLLDASPIPVPYVVEPASPNFFKNTFVNNNDHTLRCGFLSSSTNLNIDWRKDGIPLSASDMQQKYGVVWRNSNVPNVLDLRGVNVQAEGLWECSLRGTNTKASYMLNVLRYPSFTAFNSPPPVVYVTESTTVTISCAASSFDDSNSAAIPQIYINNILYSDICTTAKLTSASLCEIKKYVSVQTNMASGSLDTRWSTYTIAELPYRSSSTHASFNLFVSCKVQGNYLNQDEQQIAVAATVSTSINIVPKLTNAQFKTIDLNQCSQSICPITNQAITFLCELTDTYVTSVLSTGAVIQKYWKIGRFTKNDILAITDSESPLTKYMIFSNDDKNLTILPITSADDINTINNLGNISCVIEFYYPSFINSINLHNLIVNGTGSVQPDSSSSTMGPMFYTSEEDSNIQGLSVKLALGGITQPVVASASTGTFVAIGLASILVLIIIVILYFRCRSTEVNYLMSDAEIAKGRNPAMEFKDTIGFTNYDGNRQNHHMNGKLPVQHNVAPIATSEIRKVSISDDSVCVGSDEDNNSVNQYYEPEMGRFAEDGSFISKYKYDPRRPMRLP